MIFKFKIVKIHACINWCIKYPCVGVQTFKHSELKIKECSNTEIAHSFGPYYICSVS